MSPQTNTDDNTQFATKTEMMKWTLGVGASAVLAIISIIFNIVLFFQQSDERLTQDTREIRKETKQELIITEQKIAKLEQEIRQGFAAVYKEFAAVRAEMKQEFTAVRAEIAAQRAETKQEFAILRQEMREDRAALSQKIDMLIAQK